MAKKTFLRMAQDACNQIGLPAPTQILGNSDKFTQQILALANMEGEECAHMDGPSNGWQYLRKEWVFNFVVNQETYPLPTDWDHFIPSTEWDRSFRWRLCGPVTPQEWQVLQSGLSPLGPTERFRIMDGELYFQPTPGSTDTVVFEYISNQWALSAAGVGQVEFLADTDTYVLPDNLMTLALKYRIRQAKGLDFTAEYEAYQQAVKIAQAQQGGARTLALGSQSWTTPLISTWNIPDTGYGNYGN